MLDRIIRRFGKIRNKIASGYSSPAEIISDKGELVAIHAYVSHELANACQDEMTCYFNKKWHRAVEFNRQKNAIDEKRSDKVTEAMIDASEDTRALYAEHLSKEIYAKKLTLILASVKTSIDHLRDLLVHSSVEQKYHQ